MPNGHTEAYNREWCDERHERSREALAKLEGRLDAYEVRLRNMEVRIYIIITVLSLSGSAIGSLIGS